MKTQTFLIITLVALAGCAQDSEPMAPTPGNQTATPEAPTDIACSALDLQVAPELVTKNASIEVPISIAGTALVSLSTGDSQEVNGFHTFQMDLEPGRQPVTVTADDGCSTASATTELVRLAQATVQVTFRADAADGRDDIDETFWFDMSLLQSAPMYADCAMNHPGEATFHDMMEAWSVHSGVALTYSSCSEFGYFLTAIDGYDSPGDWCYEMDGEAQDVGMSAYAFNDGGTIAFDDCFIVLG